MKFNKISKTVESKKLLVILGVVIVLFTGSLVLVKNETDKWEGKMLPNVYVEDVLLAGKTTDEAKDEVAKTIASKFEGKNIKVVVGEKEYNYTISYKDINNNMDAKLAEAEKLGQDENFISKFIMIKFNEDQKYNIDYSLDEAKIDAIVNDVAANTNAVAKDAKISYTGSGFNVTKHILGKEINAEKLKVEIAKAVTEGNFNSGINVEVKSQEPKITEDKLKSIDTSLAEFTTSFTSDQPGRNKNIQLSTEAINGTVIMPGEEFSFNNIVGDTTPDKGYKEAAVIVGNKFVPGYGGGVCQVSTTIYNAAMGLGDITTERHQHNMAVGYVQKSTDAAIAFPYQDYKFKNNFTHPIYIQGIYTGTSITFRMYSNSSVKDPGVTYKMRGVVSETIPSPVEKQNDPSLEEGKTVTSMYGSQGFRSVSYLDKYVNGKVVESKLINKDYYNPGTTVVKVGTKKPA